MMAIQENEPVIGGYGDKGRVSLEWYARQRGTGLPYVKKRVTMSRFQWDGLLARIARNGGA